ncbi:hypothetical protein ACJJTC_013145 [Scirpophaga incertulas]
MERIVSWLVLCVAGIHASSCGYGNTSALPSQLQVCEFKKEHPIPAMLTTTAGRPIDLRETITVNSELFSKEMLLDTMLNFDRERIPERVVHAKGTAALGYFEVTHDVSHYTKADVFNGVGKKTPLVVRFSTALQSLGGPDVSKEFKGFAVKFYTSEGNLDLLCLQSPVYLYRDPLFFNFLVHTFKRNPATNLFDTTTIWDFITTRPTTLHSFLWTDSDFGIPRSYRHMDAFPIHVYEINNKKGDIFYVKFNFRTEQGLQSLTSEQLPIARQDIDYYNRDLYNSIANHTYPSWRLEMDVMTLENIKKLNYDPFDVSRQWENGTYYTVQIGRVVLNKNPDNYFKTAELSVFNPASLVPGIPGPLDFLFKGRRVFYRDTQNYRVGKNHNKVKVNKPLYAKTYTRDGRPPVLENMRDTPNYYPNSFNGPQPIVDPSLPSRRLVVFESNAVDLGPPANFYNHVLTNDAQRQRLANSVAQSLSTTIEPIRGRALTLLSLVDKDLIRRVRAALTALSAVSN